MSPTACPRSFEAEALRDERLDADQRASFARHASACAACSREVRALELLAEPLRVRSPGDLDELHVRRERTRLLAAYAATLTAPARRTSRRPWFALPALAALLAAVALWRALPVAQPVAAVVHADKSAVWSHRIEPDRELIVLESGALFIRVEPHTGKLVVSLPDGELEDIGTIFSVAVQDGHTTRVSVREGSVVLRLRGQPPVAIGAGEAWSPPAAPACPPSATPPAAEPNPRPPAAKKRDLALEFRAATGALEAGRHAEAAASFARFVADHPRDPRAEDAAYLRVIALQKLGASSGELERAVQQYLARFPHGLRRAEIEALANAR